MPGGPEVAPARVLRVLPAGEEGGGAELRPGHHRTRVRLHRGAQAALAQVGVTDWPLVLQNVPSEGS